MAAAARDLDEFKIMDILLNEMGFESTVEICKPELADGCQSESVDFAVQCQESCEIFSAAGLDCLLFEVF